MRTVDTIKSILVEQIGSYRTLLDLLLRERGCLVNLNAGEVESLSKEKDIVVLRLRLLEEERIRLIIRFSGENMLKGTVNLDRLRKITGDDAFHVLGLQLKSLLQGIDELNQFNKILIDRSLNFVKNSLNTLETSGLRIQTRSSRAAFSREV